MKKVGGKTAWVIVGPIGFGRFSHKWSKTLNASKTPEIHLPRKGLKQIDSCFRL